MIKFIQQEEAKGLSSTLADVQVNQFFIGMGGCFCQKVSDTSFIVIANGMGYPYADWSRDVSEHQSIIAVLPHIGKIEFGAAQ